MLTRVKIHRLFSVFAVAVVLFAAAVKPNALHAQATAAISGTIMDPSGAAIGVATVQVKNTGTNLTRTTTSDEVGRFRVPDLGIGEYDVEASTPGFQSVAQKV